MTHNGCLLHVHRIGTPKLFGLEKILWLFGDDKNDDDDDDSGTSL